MVITLNFEIRGNEGETFLGSYYFRSFICLQIGANFLCRFKENYWYMSKHFIYSFCCLVWFCSCSSDCCCRRSLSLGKQLMSLSGFILAFWAHGLSMYWVTTAKKTSWHWELTLFIMNRDDKTKRQWCLGWQAIERFLCLFLQGQACFPFLDLCMIPTAF